MATVREATHLVGRPIFFSMAIIILAFLPVFALTGQEGKLFHPLAFTKTFAVLGRHAALGDAGAGALHAPAGRDGCMAKAPIPCCGRSPGSIARCSAGPCGTAS